MIGRVPKPCGNSDTLTETDKCYESAEVDNAFNPPTRAIICASVHNARK